MSVRASGTLSLSRKTLDFKHLVPNHLERGQNSDQVAVHYKSFYEAEKYCKIIFVPPDCQQPTVLYHSDYATTLRERNCSGAVFLFIHSQARKRQSCRVHQVRNASWLLCIKILYMMATDGTSASHQWLPDSHTSCYRFSRD